MNNDSKHAEGRAQAMEAIEKEQQEKMLQEEKERKKKKQDQIYYLSIQKYVAEETDKTTKDMAHIQSQLELNFLFLQKHCEEVLTKLHDMDEAIADFFMKNDDSDEKKAARETLLEKTALSKKDFAAIALASQAKKPQFAKQLHALYTRSQNEEPLLRSFLNEGSAKADEALAEYYMGKPEKLEEIIVEGLKQACHEFYTQRDPLAAMEWAHHVNAIVNITSTHKTLFQNGLQGPLLEKAMEVANMGKIMENGTRAVYDLQKAQKENRLRSREETFITEASITLMCNVEQKRLATAAQISKEEARKKNIPSLIR